MIQAESKKTKDDDYDDYEDDFEVVCCIVCCVSMLFTLRLFLQVRECIFMSFSDNIIELQKCVFYILQLFLQSTLLGDHSIRLCIRSCLPLFLIVAKALGCQIELTG